MLAARPQLNYQDLLLPVMMNKLLHVCSPDVDIKSLYPNAQYVHCLYGKHADFKLVS